MFCSAEMTVLSWDMYALPETLPAPVINDLTLPLVTIVTPSLNQGQFIADTIDSVLSQDYPNTELWIIDGGSTDNTLDILRSYDDPRMHWISEPDKGQSEAINKGLRRSQGDILAYLNSDDTLMEHAINAQVTHLLEHPDTDVVYGDAVFTTVDGQVIEPLYGRPFSQADLLRFTIPTQPTVFWTRRAMDAAGPFDESYHHSMDSEYWLRLDSQGFGFTYNPQLIATYRLHEASKTISMPTRAFQDWEQLINQYAPPEIKTTVLADLYYAVAINALEHKDLHKARDYAKRALRLGIRRRTMLYALARFDYAFDTHLYRDLIQRRNNNPHKL